MSTKEQLIVDMKEAMKAGQKARLGTIRMLLASIQTKAQEKKDLALKKTQPIEELTEEEVISVVQTFKKQTEEEMEGFAQRGDSERVQTLDNARAVILDYLPKQMDREAIRRHLESLLRSARAADPDINKGGFMKLAMIDLKGKADNKVISQVVNEVLE
jgi:uncharacterized protein YqeY